MAVLAMKRIDIYALKANRKKILETLQMKNAVEVTSVKNVDTSFSKTDTSSSRAVYEKNSATVLGAVNVIDLLTGDTLKTPSMFQGRTQLSENDFNSISKNAPNIVKIASQVVLLNKRITDYRAQKVRIETQILSLEPWKNLDVSMRTISTKTTHIFIGTFPELLTEANILEKLALLLPEESEIYVEVVSSAQQQTCAFIMCHQKVAMKLETALRSMGFSYPPSPSKIPPRDQIDKLDKELISLDEKIESAEKEILSYKDLRDELIFTSDYYQARAEKYRVLGDLWQSRSVFLITGYVPAEDSEDIKLLMEENFDAHVELSAPEPKDDTPVKLKNNGYSAPVEGVIEGYSLPGKREVDPSNVMAIFYYVLFGMMLSDAAYGLIITAGCAVILAVCKNMEVRSKNTIKMFLYCGISTMFWGVMFGSYFGDVIQVIAKTFFHQELVINPLWFAPLDDPMRLLLFSMALGIVHLFAGLAMLIYTNIKNKQYKDAIYDGVFWYFLVGGLIITLVSTEMFQGMFSLSITMPSIVTTIALILAGIGAVGIISTAGRESKSPFKRLLKGLYGLYNISGYLSDILSYSRLLALGLATGVIATVFNSIAAMVAGDGGVLGAILFTLIFVVGHGMNIAINALGAYVHTNRLQYVEFFGKFYEGGGKKFEPFSTNTKYMKITEDK